MRKIEIKDFTCIDKAEITLGDRLTLLIGPQASGKSVIAKLIYFFQAVYTEEMACIEEGKSLASFKTHLKDKFLEWFPLEAVGSKVFNIAYTNNDFGYTFGRTNRNGQALDTIKMWMSKTAQDHYEEGLVLFKSVSSKTSDEEDELDAVSKFRSLYRQGYRERLSRDFISSQLFIPAGRSFFTSVGRSIVAFDQSGTLDQATRDFGRRYQPAKQRLIEAGSDSRFGFGRTVHQGTSAKELRVRLQALLGGVLHSKKEREFLKSGDGRLTPLYMLSSGQQELLPLLVMIYQLLTTRSNAKRTVYIEEPEAHLFPSSQSEIIELLATVCSTGVHGRVELFLTTHSPYVLAKINNFLLAGRISEKDDSLNNRIKEILPRTEWMYTNEVQAYAIVNQNVISIMEDGLIAADYIDDISNEISEQFSDLLDLMDVPQ